jgi:hypothetical protein
MRTTLDDRIKNNAMLIAKFEGYKVDDQSTYGAIYYSEDNERTAIDTAYHTDWNWLMPVVTLCIPITDDIHTDVDWYTALVDGLITQDIEQTYNTVVEIIKQFNKIK